MSTQQNYDKDCIIIKETVTKEEFEIVINEIKNQIKLLKEENNELRNLIKNNNVESKHNKPEIKAPENVKEILNRIRAQNLANNSDSEYLSSDEDSKNNFAKFKAQNLANNSDSEYSSSDDESKNKSIDEKQEILNRFRDQIKANNSFIASNYLN
jgi:hypothetical protein